MTMKESYLDAIGWLSEHPRNGVLVKVKNDTELKKYQKFFKAEIEYDLFLDDGLYNRIEWKIDPSTN
jgi:hypothetical protein